MWKCSRAHWAEDLDSVNSVWNINVSTNRVTISSEISSALMLKLELATGLVRWPWKRPSGRVSLLWSDDCGLRVYSCFVSQTAPCFTWILCILTLFFPQYWYWIELMRFIFLITWQCLFRYFSAFSSQKYPKKSSSYLLFFFHYKYEGDFITLDVLNCLLNTSKQAEV